MDKQENEYFQTGDVIYYISGGKIRKGRLINPEYSGSYGENGCIIESYLGNNKDIRFSKIWHKKEEALEYVLGSKK